MRKSRYLVTATVIALFLFAKVGVNSEAQAAKQLTLYYVDHGSPTTGMMRPFWPEYYRGIRDAAAMLAPFGVVVKHLSSADDLNIQAR
jgi:hypothetical protein